MSSQGEGRAEVGPISADEGEARVESSGGSLGEAKWAAMKELERHYPGLDVAHVSFEVLEDGDGDGGGGARVLARADLSAWRSDEERFDWPDEPEERVREILRRVAAHLDLRASVDVKEGDELIEARLSGSELGLLIGKRGQTIDAIQYLCGQAAFKGMEERKRVTVDAGGYRERRDAAVRRQADQAVSDALRFGRPVELDSMTAQERKSVHLYLRDRADVETQSEGDEPFRRVVISPVKRS
jgi:spoIIIJ-associated protein